MSESEVFALLITWTCYGTWLPGDRRGYVSNTLEPEGSYRPKQNAPGTPYAEDDAATRRRARSLQKWPSVLLARESAACVARALVQAARDRNWRILRAAIMANHVHVLVTDCPDDGPHVRRVLKGTTQAALSDGAGWNRRWWTAGGSDRYLHTDEAVWQAARYVAKQWGILAEIVDTQVIVAAGTEE